MQISIELQKIYDLKKAEMLLQKHNVLDTAQKNVISQAIAVKPIKEVSNGMDKVR